jgi:hypothetical protein
MLPRELAVFARSSLLHFSKILAGAAFDSSGVAVQLPV